MKITLRQMEYLTAVAQTGHFGTAAARVHVSQPALSQQIATMEGALGGQLVERKRAPVALTPLGREVVALARDILARAAQIEALARMSQSDPQSLRLGMIPTLAPYILPHLLGPFHGIFKSTEIKLREAMTDTLLAELRAGALDAVVIAQEDAGRGLDTVFLGEDAFYLAGARLSDLPETALGPHMLEPDRLLLLDEGHCLADQSISACQMPATGGIDLRSSSLATLCRLANDGLGYTLLPRIAGGEVVGAPNLRLRAFDIMVPSRGIYLVHRQETKQQSWLGPLEKLWRGAVKSAMLEADQRASTRFVTARQTDKPKVHT